MTAILIITAVVIIGVIIICTVKKSKNNPKSGLGGGSFESNKGLDPQENSIHADNNK